MAPTLVAQPGPPAGAPPPPPFFGGGGFGFGGMQQEIKLVEKFDKDGDGILNKDERKAAREYVAKMPRRRRGWGGSGNTRPGPKFSINDAKVYTNESLYDLKTLRTLFLDFEDADWQGEMADFYGTDVDIPATLTVDGKVYKDIGVHFRGNSSFFTVPAGLKRSMNLSIDYAHSKQRLLGYRTLNVLNSHTDPTHMRTVLYNQIAREYIPAPKANFVRIVINGENWGIYPNSQQFNSDFTLENYGSRKGARWHVPGSPRARGGLNYIGDDAASYKYIYEIKTKDDAKSWADLIRLCKVLSTTPVDQLEEAVSPILDIDGVIRFLALDIASLNSDGYWIRQSDYNIYEDEKGKFHVIPHDANETLREPEMGWGSSANGVKVDPFISAKDSGKVLYRLLEVPSLRTKYLMYIRDIAENWFDWRKMGPMIREYQSLIAEDVKADTHKLDSFDEFYEGSTGISESSGGGGFNSSPGFSLRSFMDQRRQYLLNLPAIKALPAK